MADPTAALRALAASSSLSSASLSADGKVLTIPVPGSDPLTADATAAHTVTHGDKSCTYSLASMYLQIVAPDQSLVQYRKACSNAGVGDAVKVTDKAVVIGYFLGDRKGDADEQAAGEAEAGAVAAAGAAAAGGAAAAVETPTKPDDERSSGGRGGGDDGPPDSSSRSRSDRKERDRDERRRREKEKERHRRDKERRKSRDRDKSRSSSSDRRDRHHRDRDRDDKHRHRDRDDADAEDRSLKKKAKAPVTNEQLMERLDVVVDKRDKRGTAAAGGEEGGTEAGRDGDGRRGGGGEDGGPTLQDDGGGVGGGQQDGTVPSLSAEAASAEEEEEAQRKLIVASLSSTGFEVRNLTDAIEADRPDVERITALEIPVGNSASVLRCGAGGGGNDAKRDFSRILDLYTEVLKEEERAKKRGGSSSSGGKRGAPSGFDKDPKRAKQGAAAQGSAQKPKPTGKPIIIVPNAMTSPITMVNAADFFGGATFVPRDVALKKAGGNARAKRGAVVAVRHRVASRLGGGEVEYEIVDNPSTRLRSSADWDRVVAVVAQGAEWQFKGWRYSRPVDLFGRCYGFYVGIEGAPIPRELLGWNVKIGKVNRDKRGLDSVTYADFWNGLDEWMNVHKPEYLPREEA